MATHKGDFYEDHEETMDLYIKVLVKRGWAILGAPVKGLGQSSGG